MKLPRRTISASGRGRCRAPGRLALRLGANLSDAAGAHRRRLCRRRRDRHRRAPDRPMAVGASRPAIRHREQAGGRQQYRHRGGRECAAGRLYLLLVGASNAINATLYENSSSISSATSPGREHHARIPYIMGVNPSFPAEDSSRVHRLCQGQPGQDQHGVGSNGTAGLCRANCSR